MCSAEHMDCEWGWGVGGLDEIGSNEWLKTNKAQPLRDGQLPLMCRPNQSALN